MHSNLLYVRACPPFLSSRDLLDVECPGQFSVQVVGFQAEDLPYFIDVLRWRAVIFSMFSNTIDIKNVVF